MDSKLTFKENTDLFLKKCSQHFHLPQKLNNFGVSQNILQAVYKKYYSGQFC